MICLIFVIMMIFSIIAIKLIKKTCAERSRSITVLTFFSYLCKTVFFTLKTNNSNNLLTTILHRIMQRLILTSLLILLSFGVWPNNNLILKKVEDTSHLYVLFENPSLNIHYYNDQFIIASIEENEKVDSKAIILDEIAFFDANGYYIVYCPLFMRESYLAQIQDIASLLYEDDNILIVKPLDANVQVPPAKNDGMVYISQREASLPKKNTKFPIITEVDPLVQNRMELVNTDSIMSYIQHLENYGT